MKQNSRIKTLALAMMIASSIFFFTPKPARALLFTTFETMVTDLLSVMNTSMETLSTTVLAMSDDIGVMADRILVMSDNIGVMADRIVTTEQLMADLVRDVTDSQGPSALVVFPAEGALISLASPLDIALSNGSTNYVLFMSNLPDMDSATNILVQDGNTISATERASAYVTGSQLYIAVKAINNDVMGPISNTVMVNIVQ